MPGRFDGLHASTFAVTTWSFAAVGSAPSTVSRPGARTSRHEVMQLGHQSLDLGESVVRGRTGSLAMFLVGSASPPLHPPGRSVHWYRRGGEILEPAKRGAAVSVTCRRELKDQSARSQNPAPMNPSTMPAVAMPAPELVAPTAA